MLTGIINATTVSQALTLMEQARHHCHAYEIRLDYLDAVNANDLAPLRTASLHPLILTHRPRRQGGQCTAKEPARLQRLINAAAILQPHAIDIEYDVNPDSLDALRQASPSSRWQRSYHHFDLTPADVTAIWQQMQHPHFYYYKIVTYAKDALDGIRLMQLAQLHPRLTAHAMGSAARFTRFASPVMQNPFTYININEDNPVLTDLPSIEECELYHLDKCNNETQLYALLGDPIDTSIGHRFHNRAFRRQQRNALYLKIPLTQAQCSDFFHLIQPLPFAGFSVTMPLKQALAPQVATPLGTLDAINTLRRDQQTGELIACNTDGPALLDCVKPLITPNHRRTLMIGSGGAANGLLAHLNARALDITVTARRYHKALQLAEHHQVTACPIDAWPSQIDLLISTIPASAWQQPQLLDQLESCLMPHTVIVDLSYNQPTHHLRQFCQQNRLPYLDGERFFIAQAKRQQHFWHHSP